jgi:hypothetical protein
MEEKNIEYYPLSFRQPDDNIRNHIINIIQNDFTINKYNKYYLLGGEATILGKLIMSGTNNIIFYTDYQSIYDDLIHNYKGQNGNRCITSLPIIKLVNYKTCDNIIFNNEDVTGDITGDILIANTGIQGLGVCLSKCLNDSGIYKMIIISCNPKSWLKDFNILKKNYKIRKTIDIKTNYVISLYIIYKIM